MSDDPIVQAFRLAVQELFNAMPEHYDIFVSVINKETGDGECMGQGCAGCHTRQVALLNEKGFYQHTGDTHIIVTESNDVVH